ncbi:GSCOCG00011595001-RA-CDS [Cotesia congregata]|nr:GSCOCG00011595001-RA-CDS [Cotesia congregata]
MKICIYGSLLVNATPFAIATSELRRSDRRGVTPHHLLYLAMKIMRLRVRDSLTIAFKHVGKYTNITRQQVESADYINNCIESNLAFLRSIPNSVWYWSDRKRDLFAMIRQLGKPTMFLTLSANEIGWTNLIQILYKLKNNGTEISAEQAASLDYISKTTLVNEDAVTCAIYFNKIVNILITILQSKKNSPFGNYYVVDYFKRIEFQHRGSPHAHILLWLNDAPSDPLGTNYQDTVMMIDQLISVSSTEASGHIRLQSHKHTFTCYKKVHANQPQKCRFDAPFMPCNSTTILKPMQKDHPGYADYAKRYKQIQINLENNDYENIEMFYAQNHITSDNDYFHILEAGITRPKVFLKRQPKEKWHNPFNPFILNVLQSNTDMQFIIEEYSCAAYVVEYVNKTNRGISNLQRQIHEIMEENPEFDIVEITRKMSVNMLNTVELTSREAAWYLLREPMSRSSVSTVYIPTVWPIERQRIRRTQKELDELNIDEDSTSIWKENWFDKYEKRPQEMEELSLAQFVANFTKNSKGDYIQFESDLDINKTIELCRKLCRENEEADDDDEIHDIATRIPEANPFQTLYDNPNSDVNNPPPLQIFFTGPAGCGKTFVIKLLMEIYNRYSESDGFCNAYITCASTGKAAVAIDGTTVHTALKISLSKLLPLSIEVAQQYRSLFKYVRVLIIDEISMIGAELLSQIDSRLKQISGNFEVNFGGLDIILIGDLRQLPPVRATPIYKQIKRQIAGSTLWRGLKFFELNEVMRQANQSFATILTKIGNGQLLDKEKLDLIESRIYSEEEAERHCPDGIRLFFDNHSVAKYNNKILDSMEEKVNSVATDIYIGCKNIEQQTSMRQKLHKMSTIDTGGLPYQITLVLNKPYMITTNIDVSDGLANGATGKLIFIEYNDKGEIGRLWLEFPGSPKIGEKLRRKAAASIQKNNLHPLAVPIDRRTSSIPLVPNKTVIVKRNHFPLVSACAMTIHKSQGATFGEIVYEYDKSHAQQLLYVALSRVTSIKKTI